MRQTTTRRAGSCFAVAFCLVSVINYTHFLPQHSYRPINPLARVVVNKVDAGKEVGRVCAEVERTYGRIVFVVTVATILRFRYKNNNVQRATKLRV